MAGAADKKLSIWPVQKIWHKSSMVSIFGDSDMYRNDQFSMHVESLPVCIYQGYPARRTSGAKN